MTVGEWKIVVPETGEFSRDKVKAVDQPMSSVDRPEIARLVDHQVAQNLARNFQRR